MGPQQIVMRRLDLYRDRLAGDLDNYCTPSDEALLQRDPFLLASIFKKALRRAERRFVFGAGKALLLLDPARLWRRLVVCAVEDFGLSDLALTGAIIAAAASKSFRGNVGGDERVLSFLLDRLLLTPCDRRMDHAYMLASAIERRLIPYPVGYENVPDAIGRFLERACELVRFCERKVPNRFYGGIQASRCDETLFRLAEEGLIEEELLELCLQARRLSHCVFPVLLPLVKAATEAFGGERVVQRQK